MKLPAIGPDTALIAVDVQRDFCPGGALAVPEGDKVVAPLNRYVEMVQQRGGKIVASRDRHPPDHVSFHSRGGPWPPHCIRGTEGAAFHSDLRLPEDAQIVSKAQEPDEEAYSAFDGTGLASDLKERGITSLLIGGLATDYCVKSTVLDALAEGFQVWLLTDAIRAVEVNAGDGERAMEEMLSVGARPLTLADLRATQLGH